MTISRACTRGRLSPRAKPAALSARPLIHDGGRAVAAACVLSLTGCLPGFSGSNGGNSPGGDGAASGDARGNEVGASVPDSAVGDSGVDATVPEAGATFGDGGPLPESGSDAAFSGDGGDASAEPAEICDAGVDYQTDMHNCGACGHDCHGGLCANALCQPVEFTIPTEDSFPYAIAAGPDGNLWFTENLGNKVGRITVDGEITEFTVPTAQAALFGLGAGPDGNVWFAEESGGKIGRITPAGEISEFELSGVLPNDVKTGSDGNLWFGDATGNIGRMTTSGSFIEFPLSSASDDPLYLVLGPDQNIWFAESPGGEIGRVTPDGGITDMAPPTGSFFGGIGSGPDGNVWFTEFRYVQGGGPPPQLGSVTPGFDFVEYSIPSQVLGNFVGGICAGPDGNVWFTEGTSNNVARITLSGTITEFPVPTSGGEPGAITAGPDGNLWFTESAGNKIGRLAP